MQLILLAGGQGSRLGPLTYANNKHFLPIHNKPMLFFPLSIGLLAGCDNVIVVTSRDYSDSMDKLIQSFPKSRVKFNIAEQNEASGVTDAIACALPFARKEPALVILGDNFLYGNSLPKLFTDAYRNCIETDKTQIFTQRRKDYEEFGVVKNCGDTVEFVEKPTREKAEELVIIGTYILDKQTLFNAPRILTVSERDEIEITSLLSHAANSVGVTVHELGQGVVWSDMGTIERMQDTSALVRSLESLTTRELANIPGILELYR